MKILIGLLVALFFFTCSCDVAKKDWKFTKDDVSFIIPGDWSITEKDDLDGVGYYLSVEKNGLESSGLYIATWVNQTVDSLYYLGELQKGFKSRKELNNVRFETFQNTYYNGIPAISSDFSFSFLNEESTGRIYVFSKSNRTYSITEQESIKNKSESQNGFQRIKSTFKIK